MSIERQDRTKRRGGLCRLGLVGMCAALVLALVAAIGAPVASASFGISLVDGQVTADAVGNPYTQAGGHPYEAWAAITLNRHTDPNTGLPYPDADAKDIVVDLPPGFVGDKAGVPTCTLGQFFDVPTSGGQCPLSSIVGRATTEAVGVDLVSPVFNLAPPRGVVASFGIYVLYQPVVINASVRPGDNGVTLTAGNLDTPGIPVVGTTLGLWGVPSDSSHDAYRCLWMSFYSGKCAGAPGDKREGPNASTLAPSPFVTLPTSCTPAGVGLKTTFRTDSWDEPGVFDERSFVSHLPPAFPAPSSEWGAPQGTTGCDSVPFAPSVKVSPTSHAASAPTGLDVTLSIPQDGLKSVGGIASADLKRALVKLPAGLAVNTAIADGLAGCSPAQVDLASAAPAACPPASKLGTVQVTTPVLEAPLGGSVYLATQGTNPFNSLLAMYVAIEDPETGIVIKLAGKVDPDPTTGQLMASFDENPQLPFETLKLQLNGGDRAPLISPPTCGTYTTEAELAGWANPSQPVTSTSAFTINEGCGNESKFTPGFAAGTTNPIGGTYSPFTLRVTRPDGQQNVSTIAATLPQGVLAKLAGVPLCGDSDAATGNCPTASQVGSATVGAGAGSNPLYVPQPGKPATAVYLAGPYKGAPYSLVAKVPAQAGPFDLGTVAVRNTINVDPTTAQVSVSSDPLPQILQGIPISYRDIRVDVNRDQFTINPTSCDPMEVKGTIGSSAGQEAKVADRFQVASCERLSFKPSLKLSVKGPTHRNAHPRFKAVLTMPNGANIQKAQVTLPKTELLENAHIRTICTRVQYAAGKGGGEQCPAASIYGKARAWSPLLDKPLEGPVYLRSSSHQLPDLVASLDSQIHIDLVGRIDAVNARIRNTFEGVPDAPVSRFVLEMQGGKKGLLANNTELCRTTPRAAVRFDAHSGKLADSNPVMKAQCGKARKQGAKKGSGHKR